MKPQRLSKAVFRAALVASAPALVGVIDGLIFCAFAAAVWSLHQSRVGKLAAIYIGGVFLWGIVLAQAEVIAGMLQGDKS